MYVTKAALWWLVVGHQKNHYSTITHFKWLSKIAEHRYDVGTNAKGLYNALASLARCVLRWFCAPNNGFGCPNGSGELRSFYGQCRSHIIVLHFPTCLDEWVKIKRTTVSTEFFTIYPVYSEYSVPLFVSSASKLTEQQFSMFWTTASKWIRLQRTTFLKTIVQTYLMPLWT